MPLSNEQRAQLSNCTSFAELHERLSEQPAVDPPMPRRLRLGGA
ncbi:hypothetical protein QNM99_08970 [Pseudomonas sp. PCH446]